MPPVASQASVLLSQKLGLGGRQSRAAETHKPETPFAMLLDPPNRPPPAANGDPPARPASRANRQPDRVRDPDPCAERPDQGCCRAGDTAAPTADVAPETGDTEAAVETAATESPGLPDAAFDPATAMLADETIIAPVAGPFPQPHPLPIPGANLGTAALAEITATPVPQAVDGLAGIVSAATGAPAAAADAHPAAPGHALPPVVAPDAAGQSAATAPHPTATSGASLPPNAPTNAATAAPADGEMPLVPVAAAPDDPEPVQHATPRVGPAGTAPRHDARASAEPPPNGNPVAEIAHTAHPNFVPVAGLHAGRDFGHLVAATARTETGASASGATAVPLEALAVEIASRAQAGRHRFEIRLDPPELGRIEVRLDIDRSGQVTSRLVVERAETLDVLRRDAHQLERALQDAGFKTSDNGMQFTLRDQAFAGRDGHAGSGPPHDAASENAAEDTNRTIADSVTAEYRRLAIARDGVDIRI